MSQKQSEKDDKMTPVDRFAFYVKFLNNPERMSVVEMCFKAYLAGIRDYKNGIIKVNEEDL